MSSRRTSSLSSGRFETAVNRFRVSTRMVLAASLAVAGLAGAQEVELKSWTAPPYWTPPAAESPGVTPGAVRGSRTALVTATPLPFVGINPCRQYDSRIRQRRCCRTRRAPCR